MHITRVVVFVLISDMLVFSCCASEALENFKKQKSELTMTTTLCAYKNEIAFKTLSIARGATPMVIEKIGDAKACEAGLRDKIKSSSDALKKEFEANPAKYEAVRDWYLGYNDGLDKSSSRPLSAVSMAPAITSLSDDLIRKLEF